MSRQVRRIHLSQKDEQKLLETLGARGTGCSKAPARQSTLLQMRQERCPRGLYDRQDATQCELISAVRSMIVQKKSPDECGAKYREETAPTRGKSR
jgi:hypothetical protein